MNATMNPRIVIVNYGSGNLRSVQKGFERMGAEAVISENSRIVEDATHLVVPGVGAFSECMKQLEHLNLVKTIHDGIRSGKPYLGICLGLQILFTVGEEFGTHPGLGLIVGKVVRFPKGEEKVPHMGWNQVQIQQTHPLWNGIPQKSFFYFVHSYYGCPEGNDWVAATTEHGISFPSAVTHDNIFACQFHPEKSQSVGLRLLSNFAKQR